MLLAVVPSRCLACLRPHRVVSFLASLALGVGLLGLAGCSGPKPRLGTLPYPGIPVLHKVVDPDELGQHRYQSFIGLLDKEQERGIIYTRRAGFVDIAHIRHTADWTRFVAERVAPAIRERASSVSFEASWDTRVHLRFDYPPGWDELPAEQREQLVRDLTILISQRTAYALGTWHEIITWWGYKRVPFSSERRSSFTYDDGISHLIGLNMAARVLRDTTLPYNEAATIALQYEMEKAQAVPPAVTRQAIDAVEGWWWNGGARKRHLETGYDGQPIHPMLVPGFGPEPIGATSRPSALSFSLPSLDDVESRGLDLSGFYTLELEPQVSQWRTIRKMLPGEPERIVPERDLPYLVEIIRDEMRQEIGPGVDILELQRPEQDH